ncbi:MAG: (d)CMP kinase [Epulopiscium sp.]|nr:(d)CMP kinase [Candidatus Epulonipiscium sp.]
MEYISIAIDGPAGAGKSTIAKAVAKALGIVYVDTGAMYRAVALYCIEHEIVERSQIEKIMDQIQIELIYEKEMQRIFLNNEDVTHKIRTPEVSKMASYVATFPSIRTQLVESQRKIAQNQSVVMDGRDIGTHVLPEAKVKIFLTATSVERAQRRYIEMKKKGISCALSEIQAEIEKRDEQDMNRSFAPLKKAKDAIEVDTTGYTIEEVVEKILKIIQQRSI